MAKEVDFEKRRRRRRRKRKKGRMEERDEEREAFHNFRLVFKEIKWKKLSALLVAAL